MHVDGVDNVVSMKKKNSQRVIKLSFVLATFLFGITQFAIALDPMWIFTVQVTASVQKDPPGITLNWPVEQGNAPGEFLASSYTIYRKGKTDTSWGLPVITLPGSATSYTDSAVSVGATYEYQIVKQATAFGGFNYTGYGYIFSGVEAELTENRGTVILVVETNATANLSAELARLQTDLTGDGWQVISHGVSSSDSPAFVKSLIVADYQADPANVTAVFLFGHVPILQSGNLNYDGHGARPMPADAYYGDVDGNWSGLPDFLPSDVELEVGRVDFFNMPGAGAAIPFPSETELLRNYLNKDHNWRVHGISVRRLALMADRFGNSDNGEPKAASGYRSFAPFVGLETSDPLQGNLIQADVADVAAATNRWISMLTDGTYLWTYACGGGFDTGISSLGLHGGYNDVWTIDVVNQDAKAVFYMLEGSHFGNWDVADNIERAALATRTMGLAVCSIAGHPHWFIHHMGLGETIGYGARLSMNNSTSYQTWSNTFPRAIYVALLGDPTLRMEPVAPVSNLTASQGNRGVVLKWTASKDSVAGYHVYRAATANGPFARVTSSLVAGNTFTDSGSSGGTYMVRAVALQTNPSGSYFNPSQGVFASVGGGDPGPTSGLVTVQMVGMGTVTPNYDGQSLEIGKTYTITAKAAKGFKFANWSGSVSGNSPKLKFVMAPGMTLTATFEDVKDPALVITYPAAKRSITNSVIAATGRASDNAAIAAVYFNFNNNGWMLASGTTNWVTPDLALIPGKNTIQAYAVDVNGNFSKTNKITFNHR
jgi:hypothetical protein